MTIRQLSFPLFMPGQHQVAIFALWLRVGLGALFIIGGFAKLRRLLDPSLSAGIVAEYLGPLGYINQTFQELLFAGSLGEVLSPWSFLTLLSAFELVAGLMLLVGFMVRPLALIWTLLLWSFVFSLPVVTTPGVNPGEATYASPAMLVQVRDIGLSGLFAALYLIGPGVRSIDADMFGVPATETREWNGAGTLMRLSLGLIFLVAGVFHGFHKIPTFGASAPVLVVIGLCLVAGVTTRLAALAAGAVLLWYVGQKLGSASGPLGWLNAIKREIALLAASAVVVVAGGGRSFTAAHIWRSILNGLALYGFETRIPVQKRT